MAKKYNLLSKTFKLKSLQKVSQTSYALIIPYSWLDALEWDQTKVLALELCPYQRKIIIHETDKLKEVNLAEEVSDFESATD